MSDEMEEIIAEFITEAQESLDKIEPLFVELEKNSEDTDLLNEIFRSMHTIKGAAGFLGFQSIVDVAHSSENIMKKLRDREISLCSQLMDTLLRAIDMLRLLLGHLKAKDGADEDVSSLVKELEAALHAAQSELASPSGGDEIDEMTVDQKSATEDSSESKSPELNNEDASSAKTASREEEQSMTNERKANAHVEKLKEKSLQNLRVDVERIDKVMDLAGEIVLVRNRLLNVCNYFDKHHENDYKIETLTETVSFLDRITSDLQLAVMKIRMQPIKKVLSKFPRFVRDISASVNKEVDLQIRGEETEVDKTVIECIGDPISHILRNSIDHGLEDPDERTAKGKSAKGQILINIFQKGNQIIIEISDDGKGMDLEKLKQTAMKKGLITTEEAAGMNDDAVTDIIFMPGFSTKDVTTELSGRGVGMDVVKTNISQLNGFVEIITEKDVGTTFRICIPLTLAILQALMVEVSGVKYAIPLSPIEETLKVAKEEIDNVYGENVIVIRDKVCPLFELNQILNTGSNGQKKTDYKYLVVISLGDKRFCIGVDRLLGQEEVVIKNLKGVDTTSSFVLGATITGDGKVVFILDVSGISRNLVSTSKN